MTLETLEQKRDVITIYNKVMVKHIIEPVAYKQQKALDIYNRVFKDDMKLKTFMNIVYLPIGLAEIEKEIQKHYDIIENLKAGVPVRAICMKLGVTRWKVRQLKEKAKQCDIY